MAEENVLPEVPPLQELALENIPMEPFDIAMIVDGIVYQTMNVDGQQAALYLAQPKFVQIYNGQTRLGYVYNEADGTFTPPSTVGQ
jgi:hypothetical protein